MEAVAPPRIARAHRSGRAPLLSLVIGSIFVLTVLAPVAAQSAPALESSRGSGVSSFSDTAGSPFAADIAWAVSAGITSGCSPTKFCPKAAVTREQMASFLARGLRLPPTRNDHFGDDATSLHQDAINRVAEAGITTGCAPGRYCPRSPVARGEMASFLARSVSLPAGSDDYFLDAFGSPHRGPIKRVAAAGISGGCAYQRYCPAVTVTREQMVAFLHRALVPTHRVAPVPTLAACSFRLQQIVDASSAGQTVRVPACTYRETVEVRKPLTLVTSGAIVDGGGTRQYGFRVSASDVTIDGFEITRTATPVQDGAVRVRSANRVTLRNLHVHHTGGSCISISGGVGHRVLDSELAYCAQQGFHLSRITDSLIAGNRIHHNNPNRAHDPEWEAGGGKAAGILRVEFRGNRVHDNRGPGLWCDVDCRSVEYIGNRIYANERAGILFEISDGAVISGNRIWENGWSKREWGWGGGIVISSSRNVEVTRNTVAWNADGISVISQNRSGDYGESPTSNWNSVVNVSVHHNDIVLAPQPSDSSARYALAWLQDWGGVLFRTASNNHGSANRYWHAQPEPSTRFAWDGSHTRLSAFNATQGESSGRYLSVSERSAILSAAGMPGAPTAR